MQIPNFLKLEGESLVFNQDGEFIFYVPEEYFDTKNAFFVNDYINIMGVLDYTIVDKNGKNNGLNPFKFPSVILTKPSSVEVLKDIKLIKTADIGNYRALHYKKGDQIVVSIYSPQDIQYVEDLVKLFLITGHIPPTIPYNKIQDYFIESAKINDMDFAVDPNIFGLIISQICRKKGDPSVEFRLTGDKNMLNYSTISIRMSPKFISPFASIISENWDNAVVGAILMNDKKKIASSQAERVFTGSPN